jgi:predicted nuclease of predicted toxin-antitoxin system
MTEHRIRYDTCAQTLGSRALDGEIFAHALERNLVVITHDQDFSTIIRTERAGRVLRLRPGHGPATRSIEQFEAALDEEIEDNRPFLMVASGAAPLVRIRIRYLDSAAEEPDRTGDEDS